MDIGNFIFNWNFIVAFFSIILIDLVLSGDNAVVIAMAVRTLSPKQRLKGIILGAGAAIILRVILTFFAAQLLNIGLVKLFGGVLITWIAIKLFIEGAPEDKFHKTAKTLKQAIVTIMIADLTMSTDNILAVAGASKGNLFLLLFGLGLSIPFLVFTSNFLAKLMDRFPIITYIGAAILGRVAGEMIITDPYIVKLFNNPAHLTDYIIQGIFAIGVIIAGKCWLKAKSNKSKIKPVLSYENENIDPFNIKKWDII
ncbi:MAG TPA: tellurium resistance protein TerC [Deltaproteobacteria bacterium]|nr:tellurium resistance protein TerC [Deltaproteobacteria bacterium]